MSVSGVKSLLTSDLKALRAPLRRGCLSAVSHTKFRKKPLESLIITTSYWSFLPSAVAAEAAPRLPLPPLGLPSFLTPSFPTFPRRRGAGTLTFVANATQPPSATRTTLRHGRAGGFGGQTAANSGFATANVESVSGHCCRSRKAAAEGRRLKTIVCR